MDTFKILKNSYDSFKTDANKMTEVYGIPTILKLNEHEFVKNFFDEPHLEENFTKNQEQIFIDKFIKKL